MFENVVAIKINILIVWSWPTMKIVDWQLFKAHKWVTASAAEQPDPAWWAQARGGGAGLIAGDQSCGHWKYLTQSDHKKVQAIKLLSFYLQLIIFSVLNRNEILVWRGVMSLIQLIYCRKNPPGQSQRIFLPTPLFERFPLDHLLGLDSSKPKFLWCM